MRRPEPASAIIATVHCKPWITYKLLDVQQSFSVSIPKCLNLISQLSLSFDTINHCLHATMPNQARRTGSLHPKELTHPFNQCNNGLPKQNLVRNNAYNKITAHQRWGLSMIMLDHNTCAATYSDVPNISWSDNLMSHQALLSTVSTRQTDEFNTFSAHNVHSCSFGYQHTTTSPQPKHIVCHEGHHWLWCHKCYAGTGSNLPLPIVNPLVPSGPLGIRGRIPSMMGTPGGKDTRPINSWRTAIKMIHASPTSHILIGIGAATGFIFADIKAQVLPCFH